MRIVASFDSWLERAYAIPASSLGLYRIAYTLVILAKALPQGLWIADFPSSFFDPPPGPTFFFFSGFPPAIFFRGLNALLVLCAVLMLFGCWTKTVSVLFAAGFTFLQAWEYSLGKINHEFIAILIPVLFAWAGWGNAWSVDASTRREQRGATQASPIALYAFIVSVMMISAGIPKITSGWLNIRTHAVLGWVINSHFTSGTTSWLSGPVLHVRSGAFWEPFDWMSCLLEVAFVCVFFRRGLLLVLCALATFFHLGILLLMPIYSWGNVLSYGAFCDWDAMVRFWPYTLVASFAAWISRQSRIVAVAAAVALAGLEFLVGNPIARVFRPTPEQYDAAVGASIVVLGFCTGAVFLWRKIARTVQNAGSASTGLDQRWMRRTRTGER